MTGIVDWAAAHARMILAFIVMSLVAGSAAYINLPKEGEPDIEIPALFVSVPFPGISAEDSESLLIKPMETELSDIDGLKTMTSTAAEGYAGVALEFEFGWDKTRTMADVRDAMNTAEGKFPDGAEKYSINEINFSEFPIVIVSLTGALPERTLLRVAMDLQDRLEGMDSVLEAPLAGHRDEMLEVVIDPVRMESYNLTASDLINAVVNNNQLIAAGELETENGAFSVKIPSSFDESRDVFNLPIKTNGDRIVTLSDVADVRLTFEDREATARYNGDATVALQVVKRKGFNLIDTVAEIRAEIDIELQTWPQELQDAVTINLSNDQSRTVASMVSQLEGSVLTAVALVMIVVLAALGARPAILVGLAIPISFLLCFLYLAIMGITVSNIVMFGLILAVGMLVDGAVVVVEYADRRISEGSGPMHAYVEASKRMFWPIISSTATTLCAFLPMLFWPGVAGEFMGMLPVTLIFVLSASLVVALVYLPVMGGVSGRLQRSFNHASAYMHRWPLLLRVVLVPVAMYLLFLGAMQTINPSYLLGLPEDGGFGTHVPGIVMFLIGASLTSITMSAVKPQRTEPAEQPGRGRTPFGYLIKAIAGNPIMPLVVVGAVVFVVMTIFSVYGQNNRGVEFFVESEPEQAIVYVRARGNLSISEKDELVKEVEQIALNTEGVQSVFAFAGDGGLNSNTAGATGPNDTIGQVQIEMIPWEDRPRTEAEGSWMRRVFLPTQVDPHYDGDAVLDRMQAEMDLIPGVYTEVLNLAMGPGSGKPVHLRIKGTDWDPIYEATETVRQKFEQTNGLIDIEDSRPLPGIDWQIDVDIEKAGRFGADVSTVGAMVQMVTRGILLDTMRVDSSDEEIEIRVRLPEDDRVLSTLDTLRVRTADGLIPLSNFITITPVQKIGEISREDQKRYFDVKADVAAGLTNEAGGPINANERITELTRWLTEENPLPVGIDWEWTGDQEDQAESQAFLSQAFLAALGLMFIILLAQFNSFYNATLVLLAVILSVAGVLLGMLVMQQPFSIIMTGTGIVALAGIVVNNNIVLIDTYQEYSRYMPRIEAIIRTAESRVRPVLLTTLTTMAGLTPMMLGLSLDFIGGGASINSPTALWWKQLATAVVFGLGTATVLTLVFTPSMLAVRVWAGTYVIALGRALSRLTKGRSSDAAQDWVLRRKARKIKSPEILWDSDDGTDDHIDQRPSGNLRAAE
ncbi:efflux RND transporter permease subunit [Qingshengfaniella alkalisoli]|uniref:Efflux RND transporter permease subunit n=1 Tax=Qingshengfaniella alkalisoli TaxID=2599296 RepID=A0A5B8IU35_9RHOB|nr:efflux RND transporter permease subunit [Qingshengfaniella alkalisoli]QDY68983.1 efflux RND transporter permease subunit [Qingshengfaniella alkalisoli]